jgi:hypothetical protein
MTFLRFVTCVCFTALLEGMRLDDCLSVIAPGDGANTIQVSDEQRSELQIFVLRPSHTTMCPPGGEFIETKPTCHAVTALGSIMTTRP